MERTFTGGRIYTRDEIEVAALCVDDEAEDDYLLAYADCREYWFRQEDEGYPHCSVGYVLSHTWKAFLLTHKGDKKK